MLNFTPGSCCCVSPAQNYSSNAFYVRAWMNVLGSSQIRPSDSQMKAIMTGLMHRSNNSDCDCSVCRSIERLQTSLSERLSKNRTFSRTSEQYFFTNEATARPGANFCVTAHDDHFWTGEE